MIQEGMHIANDHLLYIEKLIVDSYKAIIVIQFFLLFLGIRCQKI